MKGRKTMKKESGKKTTNQRRAIETAEAAQRQRAKELQELKKAHNEMTIWLQHMGLVIKTLQELQPG
jgi:hypothetical protein